MFNITIFCGVLDCPNKASYAKTYGKAEYCKKHGLELGYKPQGNICHCGKSRPNFGLEGGKAEYCSKCRKDGMVDLKHKKCEFKGCKTQPVYGYEGGKSQFCLGHKEDGMVNIHSKKCEFKGCKTEPCFGYIDGVVRFCRGHILDGMVDLRNKICSALGCRTRPVFGLEDGKPLVCKDHKLPNHRNVVHPKCSFEGCDTQPSYGFEGKREFCCFHKLKGMIDGVNKLCEFENCETRCVFGFADEEAKFCWLHKEDGMVDRKSRMCLSCSPYHRGNIKYDGYCTECFTENFPDDPRAKLVYKNFYELMVRDYLTVILPGIKFLHNQALFTRRDVCDYYRRVDLLCLYLNTYFIIEIDERQHKDRPSYYDSMRYYEIKSQLDNNKFIFIRFNPDNYISTDGIKMKTPIEERLSRLSQEVVTHYNLDN